MTITETPPPPPPGMEPPDQRRAAARPAQRPSLPNAPAGYVDKGTALNRLPKLPFEVFMLLIVGLILLTVFTVLGRISLSDAERRADAAQTDLDAAQTAAAAQVTDTAQEPDTAELDALEAEITRLSTDLAAAEARAEEPVVTASVTDESTSDEVATLTTDVAELTEALETSEQVRSALSADLDTALAALDAASIDGDEMAAQTSDAFSQYVGELVASADGLRINDDQSRCLGRSVVSSIGIEAVGAGLSSARTSASNDIVINAVVVGIGECGLDARRVFGQ